LKKLFLFSFLLFILESNSVSYHPYNKIDLMDEANNKITKILKYINSFDLKNLYKALETPYGNSSAFIYNLTKERLNKCIKNIDKEAPYFKALTSKVSSYNTVYASDTFINYNYEKLRNSLGYPFYICKETYDIKKYNPNIYIIIKEEKRDTISLDVKIDGEKVEIIFNKFSNHLYLSSRNYQLFDYIKKIK